MPPSHDDPEATSFADLGDALSGILRSGLVSVTLP